MHRTGVQKEKVTFEKKIVWKENCYKLVIVHSSYLSSPIFIMTFIMVFLFFFFSLKLFCMICIFFSFYCPWLKIGFTSKIKCDLKHFLLWLPLHKNWFRYVGYILLTILAGFEITLRQLFGILIRFKIIRKHISTQNHLCVFHPKFCIKDFDSKIIILLNGK